MSAMETFVEETGVIQMTNNLCRVCARSNELLIPIFRDKGLENELPMKIKLYLPIEVSETDKLPLHLCYHCNQCLVTWHEFITNCLKADEVLKGLSLKTENNLSESGDLKCSKQKITTTKKILNECSTIESVNWEMGVEDTVVLQDFNGSSIATVPEESSSARYCVLDRSVIENIPHSVLKIDVPEGEDSGLQDSMEDPSATENFVYSIYVSVEDEENEYYLCDINKKEDVKEINEDRTMCPLNKRQNEFIIQDFSLSHHTYAKQMSVPENSSSSTVILKCVKSRLGKTGRKCRAKLSRINNIVSCSHCEKSFRNEAVLKTHIRIHTGVTPFCCRFCGKCFRLSLSLKRHMDCCKNITEGPQSDLVCKKKGDSFSWTVYNKRFKLKSNLKQHLKSHSGRRKPKLKCDVCRAKFFRKAELLNHKLQHKESPPYICESCGKCCLGEKDLQEHRISHTDDRPFVCKTCSNCYKRKSHLVRHIANGCLGKPRKCRNSQTGDTFICETCGKECKSHQLLLLHYISHTGERKFMCPQCDQRFAQSGAMKRHIRTVHAGRKDYVCDVCKQRFTAKASMTDHMRIHTGEKPFTCTFCPKSFRTQQQHRLHQGVHLDARPYQCTYCPKRFRRKPHLVVHIRTHTGEKPYACPTCGKAFAQKNDMTKHVRVHNKFNVSTDR